MLFKHFVWIKLALLFLNHPAKISVANGQDKTDSICSLPVDCYTVAVNSPSCDHGKLAQDMYQYELALTVVGCNRRIHEDNLIQWEFDYPWKNKDILAKCSNKPTCQISKDILRNDTEYFVKASIWIPIVQELLNLTFVLIPPFNREKYFHTESNIVPRKGVGDSFVGYVQKSSAVKSPPPSYNVLLKRNFHRSRRDSSGNQNNEQENIEQEEFQENIEQDALHSPKEEFVTNVSPEKIDPKREYELLKQYLDNLYGRSDPKKNIVPSEKSDLDSSSKSLQENMEQDELQENMEQDELQGNMKQNDLSPEEKSVTDVGSKKNNNQVDPAREYGLLKQYLENMYRYDQEKLKMLNKSDQKQNNMPLQKPIETNSKNRTSENSDKKPAFKVLQPVGLIDNSNKSSFVIHKLNETLKNFTNNKTTSDEYILVMLRKDVIRLLNIFNLSKSEIKNLEKMVKVKANLINATSTESESVNSQTGLAMAQVFEQLYNMTYHASREAVKKELEKIRKEMLKFQAWGPWTAWTTCPKSCQGPSYRMKERQCLHTNCIGKSMEFAPCPADCSEYQRWTVWSAWGKCSVTCGSGIALRERKCKMIDAVCEGQSSQYKSCNLSFCPTTTTVTPITMPAVWGEWSECSVTCGIGHTFRQRYCVERDKRYCNGTVREETKPCVTVSCKHGGKRVRVQILEGADAVLHCSVKKRSKNVYWYTPHGLRIGIHTVNKRFIVVDDKLLIRETQRADAGIYFCVTQDEQTADVQMDVLWCGRDLCQHGGTCVKKRPRLHSGHRRSKCVCPQSYTGMFCETEKPETDIFLIGMISMTSSVIFLVIIAIIICFICHRKKQKQLEIQSKKGQSKKKGKGGKNVPGEDDNPNKDHNLSVVSNDNLMTEIKESDFHDFKKQNSFYMFMSEKEAGASKKSSKTDQVRDQKIGTNIDQTRARMPEPAFSVQIQEHQIQPPSNLVENYPDNDWYYVEDVPEFEFPQPPENTSQWDSVYDNIENEEKFYENYFNGNSSKGATVDNIYNEEETNAIYEEPIDVKPADDNSKFFVHVGGSKHQGKRGLPSIDSQKAVILSEMYHSGYPEKPAQKNPNLKTLLSNADPNYSSSRNTMSFTYLGSDDNGKIYSKQQQDSVAMQNASDLRSPKDKGRQFGEQEATEENSRQFMQGSDMLRGNQFWSEKKEQSHIEQNGSHNLSNVSRKLSFGESPDRYSNEKKEMKQPGSGKKKMTEEKTNKELRNGLVINPNIDSKDDLGMVHRKTYSQWQEQDGLVYMSPNTVSSKKYQRVNIDNISLKGNQVNLKTGNYTEYVDDLVYMSPTKKKGSSTKLKDSPNVHIEYENIGENVEILHKRTFKSADIGGTSEGRALYFTSTPKGNEVDVDDETEEEDEISYHHKRTYHLGNRLNKEGRDIKYQTSNMPSSEVQGMTYEMGNISNNKAGRDMMYQPSNMSNGEAREILHQVKNVDTEGGDNMSHDETRYKIHQMRNMSEADMSPDEARYKIHQMRNMSATEKNERTSQMESMPTSPGRDMFTKDDLDEMFQCIVTPAEDNDMTDVKTSHFGRPLSPISENESDRQNLSETDSFNQEDISGFTGNFKRSHEPDENEQSSMVSERSTRLENLTPGSDPEVTLMFKNKPSN